MAEMKDVFAKAESKMNKSIDHLMEEYAACLLYTSDAADD